MAKAAKQTSKKLSKTAAEDVTLKSAAATTKQKKADNTNSVKKQTKMKSVKKTTGKNEKTTTTTKDDNTTKNVPEDLPIDTDLPILRIDNTSATKDIENKMNKGSAEQTSSTQATTSAQASNVKTTTPTGKKRKGRQKINMEFIYDDERRKIIHYKRKDNPYKKLAELNKLTDYHYIIVGINGDTGAVSCQYACGDYERKYYKQCLYEVARIVMRLHLQKHKKKEPTTGKKQNATAAAKPTTTPDNNKSVNVQ